MNRSANLVRLLERRSRALHRHLPKAIAGDDTGVHQARVASRRLREAIPVLTDGLNGTKRGKADRKIRRLTRALGIVRELDVTLHLLEEMGEKPGVSRPAVVDVRAHVVEARERRRAIMHERLADVNAAKLAKRLESVRLALLEPAPGHNWRAALAARIVKRARRLDRAIADAGQIYAPEALHQVRIAAKKLRYAVEIAHESGAAPAAAAVRILKRVQDTLGRLHDLQVLQHHVAAVAAAPRPAHRDAPDVGLAALARWIEDECRHLHGRYIAILPALREALETARRPVAVRLTAPRGSRAPKMELAARRRTAVRRGSGQALRRGSGQAGGAR
jgi:CHAD domain-containing protein